MAKRRKPMKEPELLLRLESVGGPELSAFARDVLKEAGEHDIKIEWGDAGPMLKYIHDGKPENSINFGQLDANGFLARRKGGVTGDIGRQYLKAIARIIPGAELKTFKVPRGVTVESVVVGEKRSDWPQLLHLMDKKDEWFAAMDTAIDGIRKKAGPSTNGDKRRQGRMLDAATRIAIELRAMDMATAYYRAADYAVTDTSKGKPYDLECTKGQLRLRVEVKGSQSDVTEVELTVGEIRNARKKDIRTDLFVVGNIQVKKKQEGVQAYGGKVVQHVEDWVPSESHLSPTVYRYRLPD